MEDDGAKRKREELDGELSEDEAESPRKKSAVGPRALPKPGLGGKVGGTDFGGGEGEDFFFLGGGAGFGGYLIN